MKRIWKSKWFKIPFNIFLYSFAAYGIFLTATYFAMKFRWTNTSGAVDVNNRYYQLMHDKYNQGFKVDSVSMEKNKNEVVSRIHLLDEFYPVNAAYIRTTYEETQNTALALQMLDLVDYRMKDNKEYQLAKKELLEKLSDKEQVTALSVFEWMNIDEWKYFKEAVAKDKKWIDSAANVTGVEARTIVACLVGEQVRLFNSRREKFKDYIAPLKNLALETNLSYGVTGIKDKTAQRIEENLKNKSSVFYLGEEYEHLLDYDSTVNYLNSLNDTMSVRLQRLVQYTNHYYSYLYTALFIRQIEKQWSKAGFSIQNRPEIFASLFNLGYHRSVPKENPQVGGSVFKINELEYTFGGVAYDFYYSGEMADLFPFQEVKFK